jgi:histidinol dehydrogenase
MDPSVVISVAETVARVRELGASAVLNQARLYDCPELGDLFVSADELEAADAPEAEIEALLEAIRRVTEFHEVQMSVLTNDWEELPVGWGWRTDVTEGDTGFEGQRMLSLERVGVYVPGGRAAYPSSVVMNVVPARCAGVKEIVVCTPARSDGSVHPLVLVACRELGVSTVLKAGGAAGIAAMALGIEGLPRVDKIVGPGNVYVTEAKRQLWGSVGLDGFAGPSEVAVAVDGTEDPRFAAADLLTQLEHAPDNVGLLVATNQAALDAVLQEVGVQLDGAPRADVLKQALATESVAVLVSSLDETAECLNRFAPEHASLLLEHAGDLAGRLVNCGCVAIGPFTAQSAGDYCSGPSHTLPTSGAARFASPVSCLDFIKVQSVSMFTRKDITRLAPTISALAHAEGFPAHAFGAEVRA